MYGTPSGGNMITHRSWLRIKPGTPELWEGTSTCCTTVPPNFKLKSACAEIIIYQVFIIVIIIIKNEIKGDIYELANLFEFLGLYQVSKNVGINGISYIIQIYWAKTAKHPNFFGIWQTPLSWATFIYFIKFEQLRVKGRGS